MAARARRGRAAAPRRAGVRRPDPGAVRGPRSAQLRPRASADHDARPRDRRRRDRPRVEREHARAALGAGAGRRLRQVGALPRRRRGMAAPPRAARRARGLHRGRRDRPPARRRRCTLAIAHAQRLPPRLQPARLRRDAAQGADRRGRATGAGGLWLAHAAPRLPAGTDHGRALRRPAEAGARPMTAAPVPDPATFSSGAHGTVAGKRGVLRRLGDRGLDAWLHLSWTHRRLCRLAQRTPQREVLVATAYGPESRWIGPTLDELRSSRHNVRIAAGSTEELHGGKFENVNELIADHEPADWTVVIDDDVCLPRHFLDCFIALAETLEFQLAQPAQTLASHAAWASARRIPFSVARRTNFVEIGPVTVFSRTAASKLLPFPKLEMGWGLDLHWGAVAEEQGWKLGVIDALPVRHEARRVGGAYSPADASAEAQRFLTGKPYIQAA